MSVYHSSSLSILSIITWGTYNYRDDISADFRLAFSMQQKLCTESKTFSNSMGIQSTVLRSRLFHEQVLYGNNHNFIKESD
jgi:hypothetical protein